MSQPVPRPSEHRWPWLLLVAALVLTLYASRALEPLGPEGALTLLLGQGWLDGLQPYVQRFDTRPPGVWVWGAAASLLGRGMPVGLAILDTLCLLLTALLIQAWIRQARGPVMGVLASLMYAASARASVFGGYRATGQPEAGLELLLAMACAGAWGGYSLLTGLAIGAGTTLKLSSFLVIPVFVAWTGRNVRAQLLLWLGILLPWAAFLTLALVQGWADGLREALLVLGPARWASEAVDLELALSLLGRLLVHGWPALATAVIFAFFSRPTPVDRPLPRHMRALALSLIVVAASQRDVRLWQLQPVLLPLSILAAEGMVAIGFSRLSFWAVGAATFLPVSLQLETFLQHPVLSFRLSTVASRPGTESLSARLEPAHQVYTLRFTPRDEWLASFEGFPSPAKVAQLADLVTAQAMNGKTLFIDDMLPQLYLSTGLAPASRFLYTAPWLPMTASSPESPAVTQPADLLILSTVWSDPEGAVARQAPTPPAWLASRQSYLAVAELDGWWILVRQELVDSRAGAGPSSAGMRAGRGQQP